METTSLTVSLPESLKTFVERQAADGGYGTASDYVQALIREAQERAAEERLEELLLEGLEGPGAEVTPEWWQAFRDGIVERYRKANGQ